MAQGASCGDLQGGGEIDHLAIIADGNRRWARRNGFPAEAGHAQGLTAIERCCDWAIARKVGTLTVFCFSTENRNRSEGEITHILDLARLYCAEKRYWYIARGIRVRFIGREDFFPPDILDSFRALENDTAQGIALTLNICADYGGRDAIARAVASGARTETELDKVLTAEIPTPDAILRTGGDMRLSNFLLWQAAYAELFFSATLFPDLEERELDLTATAFDVRRRNYGR